MRMGERERGGVMELAGEHGGELRVCYENNGPESCSRGSGGEIDMLK